MARCYYVPGYLDFYVYCDRPSQNNIKYLLGLDVFEKSRVSCYLVSPNKMLQSTLLSRDSEVLVYRYLKTEIMLNRLKTSQNEQRLDNPRIAICTRMLFDKSICTWLKLNSLVMDNQTFCVFRLCQSQWTSIVSRTKHAQTKPAISCYLVFANKILKSTLLSFSHLQRLRYWIYWYLNTKWHWILEKVGSVSRDWISQESQFRLEWYPLTTQCNVHCVLDTCFLWQDLELR